VAVIALTAVQQHAVDALVTGGRLVAVPVDLGRAGLFMRQAQDAIVDLPNLTRMQNRYNLAYDACHDLGEALLAGYGYRTRSGSGQHEALGRFLRVVIEQSVGTTPRLFRRDPATSSSTEKVLAAFNGYATDWLALSIE
jgi:hypothetical protein